ncbi:MAG: hypothetical protein QY332_05780 [Anaerolineales bacterium]|nr:MAG: hypothetical protein QY332_05780 [Anaerolineales bacterium]
MKSLTLDQLKNLAGQTASPSISIFLPTHRAGQDTKQDPIRFKNLLREAEKQFLDSGMGPREVNMLLQPAQALLGESRFWSHQYEGLAVFMTAEDFHSYRLPFRVEELLIIARSYYVTPVLPLFTNNGHYYILAISQNEVRLFEGTRHSVGQIDLPHGLPGNLDEALRLDGREKQLQMHTGSSPGGTGDGMFHGQDPGEEEQKVRIAQYLNLVDAGLKEIFLDQGPPLVLAGVDYLLPIYRKISEYANILQEGITGGPEHLRPEELQEQAWAIVEPYFRQGTEKALEQYQQFADTDQSTDTVEEIVAAAFYGRVDKLILSVEDQVWGSFDPDTGKVILDSEGQGKQDNLALLDFAAMQTLQNGGSVYALSRDEMPTDSPVAAVFRH